MEMGPNKESDDDAADATWWHWMVQYPFLFHLLLPAGSSKSNGRSSGSGSSGGSVSAGSSRGRSDKWLMINGNDKWYMKKEKQYDTW